MGFIKIFNDYIVPGPDTWPGISGGAGGGEGVLLLRAPSV